MNVHITPTMLRDLGYSEECSNRCTYDDSCWKLLEAGSIIRDGDRYFENGAWKQSERSQIGLCVRSSHFVFCRPLPLTILITKAHLERLNLSGSCLPPETRFNPMIHRLLKRGEKITEGAECLLMSGEWKLSTKVGYPVGLTTPYTLGVYRVPVPARPAHLVKSDKAWQIMIEAEEKLRGGG